MNEPSTRLERAIAQLGAEHEPPAGWEARVLAAIEPKQPQRSLWAWLRRWWAGIAIPVLAAGAAILLIHLRAPKPLEVAFSIERDPKLVVRGGSAQGSGRVVVVPLYSRLVLTAEGGTGHRALWVYRGERELVAACPGDPKCAPGDEPRLVLTLDKIEQFQVLALSSDGELPRPTGRYDDDQAAAVEAHIDVKTREFKVE
jgi:hypothetical protein